MYWKELEWSTECWSRNPWEPELIVWLLDDLLILALLEFKVSSLGDSNSLTSSFLAYDSSICSSMGIYYDSSLNLLLRWELLRFLSSLPELSSLKLNSLATIRSDNKEIFSSSMSSYKDLSPYLNEFCYAGSRFFNLSMLRRLDCSTTLFC